MTSSTFLLLDRSGRKLRQRRKTNMEDKVVERIYKDLQHILKIYNWQYSTIAVTKNSGVFILETFTGM